MRGKDAGRILDRKAGEIKGKAKVVTKNEREFGSGNEEAAPPFDYAQGRLFAVFEGWALVRSEAGSSQCSNAPYTISRRARRYAPAGTKGICTIITANSSSCGSTQK